MKPFIIPLAIVTGGMIVAAAVYLSLPKNPARSGGTPSLVRPVGASDHIFGNPTAPVKIIEYADFDCEYCKDFNETMHQIIANEGARGDVAWIYRHFPLSEIHPNALSHARAAECVAEVAGNDAFWRFENILFANQPVEPGRYSQPAKDAGIPGDTFAACYANASARFDARIMADRQNALLVGAQGTPYSLLLVAGKPPIVMEGAYSYGAVKQLIDEALIPQ